MHADGYLLETLAVTVPLTIAMRQDSIVLLAPQQLAIRIQQRIESPIRTSSCLGERQG